VSCGKKGPPLPPLQITPARIEDVTVRRLGDETYLQFTAPQRNSNGSSPADLRDVEVFGLTGRPIDDRGRPLPDREFVAAATRVQSVEVQPPPKKDAETPPEGAPPDPRPAQGGKVSVVESLGPEVLTPWIPTPPRETSPPAEIAVVRTPLSPPLVSPPDTTLRRYYAVAGRSSHGRLAPLSRLVGVALGPLPPAPTASNVTYDETKYVVEWPTPEGARPPDAAAAGEDVIAARPVFATLPPHTYNVYEISQERAGGASQAPTPLNDAPLTATRYEAAGVRFGAERCFVVRTVEGSAGATVESEPSPQACVTARDTFAPSSPRNLAAVGSEGAINLIWEPSAGLDLAGYVVLRGEGPDAQFQPLTPAPIRETTFRDTNVRAGVRYVYAVVAVDSSTPPNASAPSNRVEETAR
jgi:hypothetical protein